MGRMLVCSPFTINQDGSCWKGVFCRHGDPLKHNGHHSYKTLYIYNFCRASECKKLAIILQIYTILEEDFKVYVVD